MNALEQLLWVVHACFEKKNGRYKSKIKMSLEPILIGYVKCKNFSQPWG